jgi:hypothetical protein
MAFDYNRAGEQRSFDVIPDKTVVVVQLNVRPGSVGEGGMLRRSKDGAAEMLDCEFVVVEGPHAKRKFFELMTLAGTTDGHAQAADISQRKLRAILESVRGVKPSDVSEAAKKARIAELEDFDGMRFLVRVGVEPGKDGFRDKNRIAVVITPDMKEWHAVEQVAPATTAKPAGNAIVKPKWAQ